MTNYIGPKQQRILTALKCGGRLYQQSGRWYCTSGTAQQYQRKERCMALYVRGFLMAGGVENVGAAHYRTRYTLTQKGRQA